MSNSANDDRQDRYYQFLKAIEAPGRFGYLGATGITCFT